MKKDQLKSHRVKLSKGVLLGCTHGGKWHCTFVMLIAWMKNDLSFREANNIVQEELQIPKQSISPIFKRLLCSHPTFIFNHHISFGYFMPLFPCMYVKVILNSTKLLTSIVTVTMQSLKENVHKHLGTSYHNPPPWTFQSKVVSYKTTYDFNISKF